MPVTTLGVLGHEGVDGVTNQLKHGVPAGADPAVVAAINTCLDAVNASPADTALQVIDAAGNQITITGPWTSGQSGPLTAGETYAVTGTAYTGSDPDILASIAGDGTINPAAETLTFNHIAPDDNPQEPTVTTKQDLIDAGICTEEDIANGEAALACFDTLFGEEQGLDEAMLCALLSTNPDEPTKLKAALMFCLTQGLEVCFNLNKEQLGEAIQNVDNDGDGEIAKITGTITVVSGGKEGKEAEPAAEPAAEPVAEERVEAEPLALDVEG